MKIQPVKELDNNCPVCGSLLYAFYEEGVHGDTATGLWYVECQEGECDYSDPEEYQMYELEEKYNIIREDNEL